MFGLLPLVMLAAVGSTEPALDKIPYRQFSPTIDGDFSEWRPPWLERGFSESSGTADQRNHVRVRMVWDLDGLLFAVEVIDHELIAAPTELKVGQFHQYDSVQIFLDGRANANVRMDEDDVDLLLLPDGRSGVLRGDALIGELANASVPQRESLSLRVDYATQRNPARDFASTNGTSTPPPAPAQLSHLQQRAPSDGWQFELRVPFVALGVKPTAGVPLGVDVASNDWLVDHPAGPGEGFTPELIRRLQIKAAAPPQLDPAVGTQVLPRSWSGGTDFGYPQTWSRLQLSGNPGVLERWWRRAGVVPVLITIALAVLVFGACCTGAIYFWHRRQLRRLLARFSQLQPASALSTADATTAAGSTPANVPMPLGPPTKVELQAQVSEPVAAEPTAVGEPALANVVAITALDPRDAEFAAAVLAHVRADLGAALTPADLAERFHVSLRTLQRRLQNGLATTPQDLVLAARLDAAQTLLRKGNSRVSEVAVQVGFDDFSHFSRRYRQTFGYPPSSEMASR